MEKTREHWVDSVKILACVLVAIGHFFQSMVESGIMADSATYQCFIKTIYYFHVPLFFICSGYLYQKGKPVNSIGSWKTNILKKLLGLGVPYVIFSLATWLLKTVFASSVNAQVDGLAESLFIRPLSPYWYLYTLFFVFLITPTLYNKRVAILAVCAAVIAKWITFSGWTSGIYAIDTLLQYEIWFVLGMHLEYMDIPNAIRKQKHIKIAGVALVLLFVVGSIGGFERKIQSSLLAFLLGILACCAVLVIFVGIHYTDRKQRIVKWIARYTMPIYLMHTIFAAGFRGVLMKIGVRNPVIHITGGLLISFAGPILAGFIMKKSKWLDFMLYPGRFIKIQSKQKELQNGEKT